MSLSLQIKIKYLSRLDELIQQGGGIPMEQRSSFASANILTGEKHYRHYNVASWPDFIEWRTCCISVLDQVVPKSSLHRSVVDSFGKLGNRPDQLKFAVSFLKSIKHDLENGFLSNLNAEIEAEIAADYLGQAERLLSGEINRDYSHVPAAVLAGAILEKSLKSICSQLSPPELAVNEKGAPLKLNALIEALKKRKFFNEIVAKQLRAWADIRNSAAHGNFEEFTRTQVESMLHGINTFLSQHS